LSSPFLSIIIPAYNEAERLPSTLRQVKGFLDNQSYDSEVLIIENGSTDDTLLIGQQYMETDQRFRAIHLEARGKGFAVKHGMLTATGAFCFMCDADLSMPVDEIGRFLPPNLTNFDIALGSREAFGAHRYNEPVYRHLGGRAINMIIRLLALPGLNDTQCGFKCFEKGAAKRIFERATISGWSFDVEVLYIARLYGYRIVELPIPWFFNPKSKLSLVKDTVRMMADIIRIRQNARQGKYGQ
jgi:dolichyl-phosphate beta-glucosyltransferase